MFSEIAPRYDLLNHLLSLNVDRRWRRAALAELAWQEHPDGTFVDLCAGTLDVAAMLTRQPGFRGLVLGTDFAEPMLRRGAGKAARHLLAPVAADALALPFPDAWSAGVVVAFGVRNLADLDRGLREVYRILAPGGRLVILEFSTPRRSLVRAAYDAYSRWVLPVVGRVVSGHRTAYRYLPESVEHFPDAEELAARIRGAGFASVRWKPLTFGIAAIHVGEKPPRDPAPAPTSAESTSRFPVPVSRLPA
jgi:demethylmenaquinone methyltransferase/2-methoxy-6-polyprenyl-1,4-benzoquinol methylase